MKPIFISILIAGSLIILAIVLPGRGSVDSVQNPDSSYGENGSSGDAGNVKMENGKQIVEIDIRGSYSPSVSNAQANVPTIIRMKSNGYLSCASALTIPALGYRKNLPLKGVTDIEIPPQESGSSLRGLCAMGMYSFVVKFN